MRDTIKDTDELRRGAPLGGNESWRQDWRNHGRMDLFLRKVIHPAASDNYRVVLHDGDDIDIASIGRQFDGWAWGIDFVIPMRETESEGSGVILRTVRGSLAPPGSASAQIRLG